MNDFSAMGRILLIVGLVVAAIGLMMMFAGKIPWIGRLPGDIFYKGKNVTFYFPVTTSIVISLLLTLLLWLINRK